MEKFTIKRKIVVEEDVTFKKFTAYKIRELREKKKLTQEDFADLIGLSRASIVNIEKGRQAISMKNLYLICTKLDVKSSELLPF